MDYPTGAVRDTGGKGRMDLLPWSALLRVSRHVENSLADHEERNWERGLPMHCFLDSAFRHMAKYMEGWDDEDHLAAAATNLLMAMWTEEHLPEMQDIPPRVPRTLADALREYASEGTGCPSVTREEAGRYQRPGSTAEGRGGAAEGSVDGGYLARQRG